MDDHPPPPPKACFGERHKQMLLLTFGIAVAYLQKNMLSIGVVAMTDPEQTIYPVLDYTTAQKGILISALFYGYMVGSLPMGLLVSKFGAARVLSLVCGILFGLITASVPLIAIYLGFEAMFAVRAIHGFLFGSLVSGSMTMLSKWVVPPEREKFTWTFIGIHASSVLSSLLGVLAASPAGWPSIFYVTGIAGIIWGTIFYFYGIGEPADHLTISKEEKDFILYYYKDDHDESQYPNLREVPWFHMLTSIPVWASIYTQAAERWCTNTLNNFFPTFLRGVYGYDIETNGFLSSLPGVATIVFTFSFAYLGGKARSRLSLNTSRKLWSSIACLVPGTLLLILGLTNTGATGAITIVTLVIATFAANTNGAFINQIDLTPRWASVLTGIVFIPTSLSAIAGTTFAGYAIADEHNFSDWQLVFLVSAAVTISGGVVFLLLGSTTVQSWNSAGAIAKSDETKENKN